MVAMSTLNNDQPECSNCSTTSLLVTTTLKTSFSLFHEEDYGRSQMDVIRNSKAFSTIFEGRCELDQFQEQRYAGRADTDNDLVLLNMCMQCTSMLAELYKYYTGFLKLTRQGSRVQRLIKRSMLWDVWDNSDLTLVETKPLPVLLFTEDVDMDNDSQFTTGNNDWFANDTVVAKEFLSSGTMNVVEEEEASSLGDKKFEFGNLGGHPGHRTYPCKKCGVLFENLKEVQTHDAIDHKQTVDCGIKLTPLRPVSKRKRLKKSVAQAKSSRARSKVIHVTRKTKSEDKSTKKKPRRNRKAATPATADPAPLSILCPHCGMEFTSKREYSYHCETKHPSQTYPCPQPLCTKTYLLHAKLAWHLVLAHGIGPRLAELECPLPTCNKYFATPKELKQHTKLVHIDESAKRQCTLCPRKFSTKFQLTTHVKDFHEGVKYKCNLCDKVYTSVYPLRIHVREVHGGGSNTSVVRVECPICGKTSNKRNYLRAHMRIHEGRKELQCDKCPKTFPHQPSLYAHVARVHKNKSYECKECQLAFAQASGLRRHNLLKHTALDTPPAHICTICGKGFKLKELLTAHMTAKSHGGPGLGNVRKSAQLAEEKEKQIQLELP